MNNIYNIVCKYIYMLEHDNSLLGKTAKAIQRDIGYVLKDSNYVIDRVRQVFNVRMNPCDFHPKRFICCIADIVLQYN